MKGASVSNLQRLLGCIYSDTINADSFPNLTVNTITKTDEFDAWLSDLSDLVAKAKILARIRRAELGNFGDSQKTDIKRAKAMWAMILKG